MIAFNNYREEIPSCSLLISMDLCSQIKSSFLSKFWKRIEWLALLFEVMFGLDICDQGTGTICFLPSVIPILSMRDASFHRLSTTEPLLLAIDLWVNGRENVWESGDCANQPVIIVLSSKKATYRWAGLMKQQWTCNENQKHQLQLLQDDKNYQFSTWSYRTLEIQSKWWLMRRWWECRTQNTQVS